MDKDWRHESYSEDGCMISDCNGTLLTETLPGGVATGGKHARYYASCQQLRHST
jgi:hypothetical protein